MSVACEHGFFSLERENNENDCINTHCLMAEMMPVDAS